MVPVKAQQRNLRKLHVTKQNSNLKTKLKKMVQREKTKPKSQACCKYRSTTTTEKKFFLYLWHVYVFGCLEHCST